MNRAPKLRHAAVAVAASVLVPVLTVVPHTARADGLPSVASGERPGPDVLYEPPATAPELGNAPGGVWDAAPLLVSGADAYVDGEYLYQDYVYDDHGAMTLPGPQSPQQVPDLGVASFSQTTGKVTYPTDTKYANNAADLLELRVDQDGANLYFRMTFQTLTADASAFIAGIGFETDHVATTGLSSFPGANYHRDRERRHSVSIASSPSRATGSSPGSQTPTPTPTAIGPPSRRPARFRSM